MTHQDDMLQHKECITLCPDGKLSDFVRMLYMVVLQLVSAWVCGHILALIRHVACATLTCSATSLHAAQEFGVLGGATRRPSPCSA